jgi:16S rRNA (guanine966-N2)-methyltransferase
MRIIGGSLKGRKVVLPKKVKTRPTTDFAREALFSMLENQYDLEDCTVYDFFAGLGSISFEFISRGAKEVVAVDVAQTSRQFIQEVAEKFEISDKIRVVKADFFKVVKVFDTPVDFIFADPPFTSKKYADIVAIILERKLLKEDGVLIVEHHKTIDLSTLEGWQNTRNYGHLSFSFFKQV